jgi:hypothetical protein
MSVDVEALGTGMIAAAREVVATRWPALRALAEVELRRLAISLQDVARLLQDGDINAERARHLIHIHRVTAHSVMKTVEGLGLKTAKDATGAALRSASSIINRAVGFNLLEGVTLDFKAGKDLDL